MVRHRTLFFFEIVENSTPKVGAKMCDFKEFLLFFLFQRWGKLQELGNVHVRK
jgi:hypothetical protein